jgi:site-specific DNA-cytosine methylase
MPAGFAIVDLFAGPGGLAEGFSSVRGKNGSQPFHIALSVEKEASAFETLRLRSFFRQFEDDPPVDYYRFLNGEIPEPDWETLFPVEWTKACREALKLELGSPDTTEQIDQRLQEITDEYGGNVILIGGPPCQAYSLVGRARNKGTEGYEASKDHRHFLYKEYIRILQRLKPAAFVMENVKGLLSSSVNGERIFDLVLDDLSKVGNGSYRLVPLAPRSGQSLFGQAIRSTASDFVVRAEDHGIPQSRHRVIIVGIRSDVAAALNESQIQAALLPRSRLPVAVRDVLKGMPKLRSGLSDRDDSEETWRSETSRMMWNYWLNFNVSNKDGSGRGGRGIGRVTFLIASRLQAVIGMTRRISDNCKVACGMCVLKAVVEPEGLRSTHAYLASAESNSIYELHGSAKFLSDLQLAFNLDGYDSGTGLALVIPYPHEELTRSGILASAIEHFAPAILSGALVVRVDDDVLDHATIDNVAESVSYLIHSKPIAEDVTRYLSLIRAGMASSVVDIEVPALGKGLVQLRDNPIVKKVQISSEKGQTVALRISFPIVRNGRAEKVSLRAALARTPTAKSPIDRFFREGMSLPDLKARNPGELDLVVMVEDVTLARYLNLCEGKAHLDISQSKEIKTKLEDNGFVPPYPVKNFVKSLPIELRSLLTPEITAPDSSVFEAFFSLPDGAPGQDSAKKDRLDEPPPPPPPPPPPRISPLTVETLQNGFRVKANPKFLDWPVNMLLRMAYADGSRKPAWSELDFRPTDLKVDAAGCKFEFLKNRIQAKDCGSSCFIEVTGFDTNLELDTQIRFWKNAQAD